jgi:hypothetical protein
VRTYLLTLALFVGAATGCASEAPAREHHEDQPKAFLQARQVEDQATTEIRHGNNTRDVGKRKEFYDRAIALMRRARRLYEDELINDPGTPEKRDNLDREINRLDAEIKRIHEERPL